MHATRLLRRSPVLTITATLSLAIGIGASTTNLSVSERAPARACCGLVRTVPSRGHRQQSGRRWLRPHLVSELPRHPSARHDSDGVYAYSRFPQAMSVGGAGLTADSVFASLVTVNYFTVLGAVPAAGRLFGAGDSDQPGASPVAVLSHGLWTRRFDRDATVVGRTLRLNGHPFTVVGVAAEGFHGTGVRALDIWVPMGMVGTVTSRGTLNDRAARGFLIGGRLNPGVPIAQAAAEIDVIGQTLEHEYPGHRIAEPGYDCLPPLPFQDTSDRLRRIRRVADGDRVVRVDHRVRKRRGPSSCSRGCPAPGDGLCASRLVRTRTTHPATADRNGVAGRAWRRVRSLAGLGDDVRALHLPTPDAAVSCGCLAHARGPRVRFHCGTLAGGSAAVGPGARARRVDEPISFRASRMTRHWAAAGVCDTPSSSPRWRSASCSSSAPACSSARFIGPLRSIRGFDSHGVELISIDLAQAGYTDMTGPPFVREVLDRIRQMPEVQTATIATALPGGFEVRRKVKR